MSTNNPVSQMLVATGNQALLAAGSRESALAIGQLGIFNYHTGLSVDGTVLGDCRDVYFAVGTDPDATGVLTDVNRSAGQMIQVRHAKSLTVKGYIAPLPKIVELAGFAAKCETSYAAKIEFRSQKSYGVNGYNQFSKTYSFKTSCCTEEDCATCPQGDCNELVVGMATNINNDPDHLVTASYFVNIIHATIVTAPTADGTITFTVGTESFSAAILDADTQTGVATKIAAAVNAVTTAGYFASSSAAILTFYPKSQKTANTATFALTSAGGSGITVGTITSANSVVSDTAAFIAANPGVCIGMRLTGGSDLAPAFNGSIPLQYYNPRGIDFLVSLIDGFACNGVVTTTQEVQYEEGEGLDIQAEEYLYAGWKGSTYRLSAINGVQKGNITYFATKGAKYNILRLAYDIVSKTSAWLEHSNNEMTSIAIPCADSTTLTGLVAVTDLIFSQFTPFTNDVASMDCTNVPVHTGNSYATDGIETLA